MRVQARTQDAGSVMRKVAGATAAAAILFSSTPAGPALAFSLPGLGGGDQAQSSGNREASSVQDRISGADSIPKGQQPDKGNTLYPINAGGIGGGKVPPAAGRSNLESTSAAPEQVRGK